MFKKKEKKEKPEDVSGIVREPTKVSLLVEYRIPMFMTTEEYRRGQLYVTAKSSWETTLDSAGAGSGEGVTVLENEPVEEVNPNIAVHGKHAERERFSSEGCQRTLKHIHFGKALPKIASAALPKEAKFIEELGFNSYPYTLTLYSSKQSYLATKLYISVESMHYDNDRGENDNVFSLSEAELAKREVVNMDIAHDHVGTPPPLPGQEVAKEKDKKEKCVMPTGDPRVTRSEKTGRGPLLSKEWRKEAAPSMCVYKMVRVTCDVPLVKSKVERAVLKSAIHDMILNTQKNIFCTLDEYIWLDTEQIREFEARAFDASAAALKGDTGPAERLELPKQPETKPDWVQ